MYPNSLSSLLRWFEKNEGHLDRWSLRNLVLLRSAKYITLSQASCLDKLIRGLHMTLPMQLIDRSLPLLRAPEALFSHKTRKGRRLERMLGLVGLVGHIVILSSWNSCYPTCTSGHSVGISRSSTRQVSKASHWLVESWVALVLALPWALQRMAGQPPNPCRSWTQFMHHADRNGFDLNKSLDLYLWYLVVIDCTFPYIAKLCCSSFFLHYIFFFYRFSSLMWTSSFWRWGMLRECPCCMVPRKLVQEKIAEVERSLEYLETW